MINNITNIQTRNNIASALFRTNDIAEANLLRRAMLAEIETYAIDIVIFHVNTSPRHDEIIAFRLGQLVIDHSNFDVSMVGERVSIDVSGPRNFTTEHIRGISFTKPYTPICTLRANQRIKCDVIIKAGYGKEHCKWRPISSVSILDVKRGYFISSVDISKEFKVDEKETHYIDSVIIYNNTSRIDNEYIAMHIGQLQIDYNKFDSPRDDVTTISIDFEGPGDFIAEDLPGIKLKYHAAIGHIDDGQRITCDIMLVRGRRTEYIKWKTYEIDLSDEDNGFFFRFKNIGMLTTEEIFTAGYNKIAEAANYPAITLFSHVLVPSNMKPQEII